MPIDGILPARITYLHRRRQPLLSHPPAVRCTALKKDTKTPLVDAIHVDSATQMSATDGRGLESTLCPIVANLGQYVDLDVSPRSIPRFLYQSSSLIAPGMDAIKQGMCLGRRDSLQATAVDPISAFVADAHLTSQNEVDQLSKTLFQTCIRYDLVGAGDDPFYTSGLRTLRRTERRYINPSDFAIFFIAKAFEISLSQSNLTLSKDAAHLHPLCHHRLCDTSPEYLGLVTRLHYEKEGFGALVRTVGSGGETNLKGMADPSDTSLSFQIPTCGLGEDYLLEYDDDSFLKGADNIPVTPAPSSRFTLEPLTINDLTPRPSQPTHVSFKASPKPIRSRTPPAAAQGTPARRTSSRIQHKPKPTPLSRITQEEVSIPQSPRGERIDSLRAQLDSLAEELGNIQEPKQPDSLNLPPAADTSKQKGHRREGSTQRKEPAKPTVVREGGIAKGRLPRGVRRTSIAHLAAKALVRETLFQKGELPSIQSPPSQAPDPESNANAEPSVGSGVSLNAANELMVPRENLVDPHVPNMPESSSSQTSLEAPSPANSVATDSNVAAAVPVTADHYPLTISQLSPPKPASSKELASMKADNDAAVESAVEVEASLRTSAKRPVSVEDSGDIEGARVRKRGRLDPSVDLSSSTAPSSSKHTATGLLTTRRQPTSRKSIRRPSSSGPGSRSTLGRRKSSGKATTKANRAGNSKIGNVRSEQDEKREGPGASTSREPRAVGKDNDENSTTQVSNHTENSEDEPQAESSHHNQDHWDPVQPEPVPAPPAPTRVTRSSSRLASGSGSSSSKPKVNIVAATIPVGFRFSVDARLEARSRSAAGESEDRKAKSTSSLLKGKGKAKEVPTGGVRKRPAVTRSQGAMASLKRSLPTVDKELYSVPDFKSLHAANNAALARKRQKVLQEAHPTIPVAPRFATDARLEERHKFEEKVKEKERREREEMEAKRRQQQEEQERELRELRKKAVPKAHEVPEWYKDAPKKVK
ncbi:hypothetical protein NMY22_g13950 [Coprinellus aureogranulatus]|nr:hypothetical protein NMY22_g13950 [Coprinellus aureogranulatus]